MALMLGDRVSSSLCEGALAASLSAVIRMSRRVLAVAALAGLAACSNGSDFYPTKGDVKPHPGVAKAKLHPIQGIDISKWQGPVDWASVRAAGTQFAFIKATEGGDHVDERFRANWDGAAAAGVPRGPTTSCSGAAPPATR